MALLVLVTVAMLLLARRGRWVVALAVLSLALLLHPQVRQRLPRAVEAIQQPMKIGAIYDRVHVWRTVVVGVVRDRPLFGAGPRNFNFIDKRHYGLGRSWDYFNHAHSLYMNVAAETGLLGLGVLVGWLGLFLGSWWSERRRLADGLARILWLGAGGAFLVLTVSGIVTTTLHTEGAMLLMAIWGLFFFAQRMEGG
jgi:O-antigen ligase